MMHIVLGHASSKGLHMLGHQEFGEDFMITNTIKERDFAGKAHAKLCDPGILEMGATQLCFGSNW